MGLGRRLSQGGARGVTALAAAAALTAGGGTAIGWATTHQDHAPQPTAAVAGTLAARRAVGRRVPGDRQRDAIRAGDRTAAAAAAAVASGTSAHPGD